MAARIRARPLGPTLVVVVVVCLLAGLAGIAIAVRQERPVTATPGPGPYSVAQVVDTNPDPDIVETDITAEEAVLDVGNGVMAKMWTFNGSVPGPQFRLKVGDTVIVHFKNLLPEATGIHWHGIELANASDGTPLTQNQVATNDTFVYKFIVSRPGIFWYHPHHHASTNHVFRGLYGSMIVTDNKNEESTLVANGVLPTAAQTKTLVLSDTTVCAASDPSPLCSAPMDHHGNPIVPVVPLAAGEIPNIQPVFDAVDEGRTLLTNGVNVGGRAGTPTSPGALDAGASTLDVQAGQGLRLQLVDAATIRYYRLVLTDDAGTPITLFRVGGEGGLLDKAIVEGGVIGGYDTNSPPGEIVIAPGDRADVVAAIPPSATGVLTLWTQTFPRDPSSPGPPTAPVAHFKVNGVASSPYTISAGTGLLTDPAVNAPIEVLPAPTASLLDPAAFTPAKPGLAAQNIAMTEQANVPGGFGFDHVQGTHDGLGDYTNLPHMGSTRYAKVGDVLELTVGNEFAALRHPFHLHGFSFQPLSLTPWPGAEAPVPTASYTFPYHEFIDEMDIPAKYVLTFRVRLDDRPQMDGVTPGGAVGRWMFHCHLFHHSTFGLMSEFDVVAADGNERPYVNAESTPIVANEGDTITNHGTWMDPDGDAVTLTASVGTVVKDPGGVAGAWSWSYTVPPGASEHVYITATDAGAKKDQAIFELDVNARPLVAIAGGQSTSIAEGGTLNVAANFTDSRDDGPYTATINFGTGAAPQVVTPTVTHSTAPVAGNVGGSFQYPNAGTFTVTVTLTDSHGLTGSASFTATVTPAPPVGNAPSAPQSVSASPFDSAGVVSFSPPLDNGGSPITNYTTACTSFNGGTSRTVSALGSPIVVTGLTNGAAYRCTVTATNAIGTSTPSGESNSFVPQSPPPPPPQATVPGVPRALSAVAGNGRATLHWRAPVSDGGSVITGYVVTSYIGLNAQFATVFSSPATTGVMTGLTNGKQYRFKVAARNAVGAGASSTASAPITVGIPATPSKPVVTRVKSGSLKIAFVAPGANGAPVKSYSATCTSSNGGVARTKTSTKVSPPSPIVIAGLTAGKAYACTVRATNSRGYGLPSAKSLSVRA